jgi:predicted GNAT family acetyltransferase
MDFTHENNRIYARDGSGSVIAEITFPVCREGVVEIDRTFVDPSLRGQGVADKLVRAVVGDIREAGVKATVSCTYAQRWFAEHPDQADVLA